MKIVNEESSGVASINPDLDLETLFKERLEDLQECSKEELIRLVIGLESELFFSEQEKISLLSQLFLSDTKIYENIRSET